MVIVNVTNVCNGCGGPGKAICVKSCPVNILEVKNDHPSNPNAKGIVHVLNDSKCVECVACEKFCPVDAIFINPPDFNTKPEVGLAFYDTIE
ncbi:MAG: 4Fe-4S dicluster domain-containing protein [Candidatus Hodarchaeales archaeon]